MRIGLEIPPKVVGEAARGGKAEHATGPRERARASTDEARLSADRDTVQSLHAELWRLPELRMEKVEALRKAITNGDYRVSPERIAEAMYRDLAVLSHQD